MNEYTVVVTAMRGDERLTATVKTNATNTRYALSYATGIESDDLYWYSWTYREQVGYIDDAVIISYEVMQ